MSDNTFYEGFVMDMFRRNAKDHGAYLRAFGQLHAAVGLAGEAGEVLDIFKKYAFTEKPVDRNELIKELGDVEFYLQALRTTTGISRHDILNANVEKLEARHPGGFENSNYYKESE